MSKTVAFFGLGNMGLGMAANLAKTDCRVYAFDLSAPALKKAQAQGCIIADSAEEAVKNADFIISMLPTGEIVENLFINNEALLSIIPKTALVIDCSTVSPETSQRLALEADKHNINTIDAPVSGGTAAAAAGSLSFMCGGSEENCKKAEAVLLSMGNHVFRAGDHGAGAMAKICNNMLLAIHMAGTAEALQLGVNNGLDPGVLSEIMHNSSGNNWTLEKYNPYPEVMQNAPASHDYQGGFMVNLMCKDLNLAMGAASHSQSYTPMGTLVTSLYKNHCDGSEAENGTLDFSSIQKIFPQK